MAGEWKRTILADAIDLISGGTPKTSVPDYWGGDIPWLSVSDFNTGYRWVSTAEKSITDRGLAESATAVLNRGDVIISARGTVGVVAQLAKPMAFNQSCYGIRGKREIAEADFIYYALRHAVSEMKQVAHGGVFDTITRDTFKIIEIDLPPLKQQQAIAHILGTLDDKIELNRKMNRTLEAMAQAIFKSWFVDFDPVR
ncbi:MAG: restriction endonuclease subunit S, partial [Smithellaceae bacterium]|nr:restriction endonuclease subunit S [Smithellaceae bacterium]